MSEKVVYATDPTRDLQTLKCYRLNKFFMGVIGLWPFSASRQRVGVTILVCMLGNFYILEIAYIFKSRRNFDLIIECIAPVMIHTVIFAKLTALLVGAKTVMGFFVQMQYDWNTITDENEIRILQEYANKSNVFTIGYVAWMLFTLFGYLITPTIPIILDYVKPLNESRKKQFPSHVTYFVEQSTIERLNFYWPAYFHQSLGSFSLIALIVICYTTHFTCVEYVCGIFASLNYKLEHLTDEEEESEENSYAPSEGNRVFAKVVDCIHQHRRAIQYAEHIENTYCIANLVEIIMVIGALSLNGVQAVLHLRQIEISLRLALYCVTIIVHVFFVSLPGQELYDHSTSIFEAAYKCKWYTTSKKSQFSLKFIMLRSLTPCQLTAGKFYVTNLKTFSSVVQTSMSYFTVLNSRG